MSNNVLFWKIMKLFNLNKFFRKNIKTLRFVGKFYIRRHWSVVSVFEAVRLEGFNDKTNKVIVRKVINKTQTAEAEPEQLFLNAHR